MLVVDIETIPLAASLAATYPEAERNPPSNYKSDEAIAKWRGADRVRWQGDRAKECSLNPRLGRVLCVGMDFTDCDAPCVAYAQTEADEREALDKFWTSVVGAAGMVVTWNGAWDLRFLLIRSLALGVKPIDSRMTRDWFRRYTTLPHFDCKAVLLNGDVKVAGEGLDEWAAFFGLPGKTATGADVWPMYQRGEHDAIAAYCAQDVAATKAIHARIAPFYG